MRVVSVSMRRASLAVAILGLLALAGGGVFAATSSDSARDGWTGPIDLNVATVAQLEEVPGIGAAMAARIVAWRKDHGPFRRLEDLMKVKGIGEKSFEKLRPYFTVVAAD